MNLYRDQALHAADMSSLLGEIYDSLLLSISPDDYSFVPRIEAVLFGEIKTEEEREQLRRASSSPRLTPENRPINEIESLRQAVKTLKWEVIARDNALRLAHKVACDDQLTPKMWAEALISKAKVDMQGVPTNYNEWAAERRKDPWFRVYLCFEDLRLELGHFRNRQTPESLYCDENDRYFNEIEEAFYYFAEQDISPAGAPEYIYGCKYAEVSRDTCEWLANELIESIDNDKPELSTEDEYFSGMLNEKDKTFLEDLIGLWLKFTVSTIEPDYDQKISFRDDYEKYLRELAAAERKL